jgi:CBS domain-containing protein
MHRIPLTPLAVRSLPVPGTEPWHVRHSDPALLAMTDFRDRPSVTVSTVTSVDEALEHMKHAGVRSAFVTDTTSSQVVGLVTAYDVIGEKPMRQRLAGIAREEVSVREVMTPVSEWQVAHFHDIERATMADVAAVFAHSGLTHLPVVERGANGTVTVRGLFSAAKITRVLKPTGTAHAEPAPLRREAR